MHTTVVIPTYNERENIGELIRRIAALSLADVSILVVDDNSPDGTADAVNNLEAEFPFIACLPRDRKRGLGSAYIAGFREALRQGAVVVMEMDADLSHAPEDIPRLLSAIQEGADVAVGSRRIPGGRIEGWNWRRHCASQGAVWLSKLMLGIRTNDATSGFRAYRREVLEVIQYDTVKSDGYAFQEEILLRCERAGYRIMEVPITFIDRRRGSSKLGIREIVSFFITLVRLWKKQ